MFRRTDWNLQAAEAIGRATRDQSVGEPPAWRNGAMDPHSRKRYDQSTPVVTSARPWIAHGERGGRRRQAVASGGGVRRGLLGSTRLWQIVSPGHSPAVDDSRAADHGYF